MFHSATPITSPLDSGAGARPNPVAPAPSANVRVVGPWTPMALPSTPVRLHRRQSDIQDGRRRSKTGKRNRRAAAKAAPKAVPDPRSHHSLWQYLYCYNSCDLRIRDSYPTHSNREAMEDQDEILYIEDDDNLDAGDPQQASHVRPPTTRQPSPPRYSVPTRNKTKAIAKRTVDDGENEEEPAAEYRYWLTITQAIGTISELNQNPIVQKTVVDILYKAHNKEAPGLFVPVARQLIAWFSSLSSEFYEEYIVEDDDDIEESEDEDVFAYVPSAGTTPSLNSNITRRHTLTHEHSQDSVICRQTIRTIRTKLGIERAPAGLPKRWDDAAFEASR
ncbi:hypothetical protein SISSUDRAFT_1067890 [Sistotremastrum suecicum HHB10207 ss-3]|uniref:Uncharacterized protein n=1 Tax=Sistotremastrum suecicum HHB10207 ss-3 TaxID=1314776 RepID=A0A165WL56_9AGAM|nr:hypothetical protein SISSUDRAFT_1067890 [Sistotremastrum suecicum HHB10207 ss-3]